MMNIESYLRIRALRSRITSCLHASLPHTSHPANMGLPETKPVILEGASGCNQCGSEGSVSHGVLVPPHPKFKGLGQEALPPWLERCVAQVG